MRGSEKPSGRAHKGRTRCASRAPTEHAARDADPPIPSHFDMTWKVHCTVGRHHCARGAAMVLHKAVGGTTPRGDEIFGGSLAIGFPRVGLVAPLLCQFVRRKRPLGLLQWTWSYSTLTSLRCFLSVEPRHQGVGAPLPPHFVSSFDGKGQDCLRSTGACPLPPRWSRPLCVLTRSLSGQQLNVFAPPVLCAPPVRAPPLEHDTPRARHTSSTTHLESVDAAAVRSPRSFSIRGRNPRPPGSSRPGGASG